MDLTVDMGQPLTARTRSNEVLPAFCKPTMVTSISVALAHVVSNRQQDSMTRFRPLVRDDGDTVVEVDAQVRTRRADLPERPEQPVIHLPKQSRHPFIVKLA